MDRCGTFPPVVKKWKLLNVNQHKDHLCRSIQFGEGWTVSLSGYGCVDRASWECYQGRRFPQSGQSKFLFPPLFPGQITNMNESRWMEQQLWPKLLCILLVSAEEMDGGEGEKPPPQSSFAPLMRWKRNEQLLCLVRPSELFVIKTGRCSGSRYQVGDVTLRKSHEESSLHDCLRCPLKPFTNPKTVATSNSAETFRRC
jgi:hypothetical protein